MELSVKTFSRRDSATAILRNLGVPKANYDQHITKTADGKYQLTIPLIPSAKHNGAATVEELVGDQVANENLTNEPAQDEVVDEPVAEAKPTKAKKTKPVKEPKAKPAKAKKEPKAKEPKEPRVTIAGRARELIAAGHDNAQVFEILQDEFGLDDSKKHYPGWYRSQMKRAGQL